MSSEMAPHSLRANRVAVSVAFFLNGLMFASWVLHIPSIQARLGIGEAALGLALLSLSLGAVTALLLAARVLAAFGSRAVTAAATLLNCLLLPLPVLAPSFGLLVAALVLFGFSSGIMDVAMNAQAAEIEKRHGAPLMSSFHGLFSLGGLAGAGAGGALLALVRLPSLHVLIVASAGCLAAAAASRHLLPATPQGKAARPVFTLPPSALLGLCLLAFISMISEGSMADWSGVYFRKTLAVPPEAAGLGYAAFSLAMAAARFAGDRLNRAAGPVRLSRVAAGLAAAGMTVALLSTGPLAAAAGFALVGLGLANVIPLIFSAAGRFPGLSPGAGIAAVATVGYTGFLVGPPALGFVAEAFSLRAALGIVAGLIVLLGVLAHWLAPRR